MAKPVAFLPHPRHRNSSVFRIGRDEELIRQSYEKYGNSPQSLKAAAVFTAKIVRAQGLDAIADEPPPAHANIGGWNWDDDPELAKARQKEQALGIASKAVLIRL